ncbi:MULTISPECIES: hypothetical protein [unclassified Duganella]|uniref:hypothetical protein n=1 Tax=unclassified Duganella TaxID=2636909 RepID=UPI0011C19CFB|nr:MULTISPECIES: hypothetical protein [unclassified Duganella]
MDPFSKPNVFDLRRKQGGMRNTVHYLDNCMFVAHDNDPDINRILALHEAREAVFVMPRSVKNEVDNPRTPEPARNKASGMLFTFPVNPSKDEERKRRMVDEILIGKSKGDKHVADAAHVLEAGIHHGYFITSDGRVNDKKDQLKAACGVRIVRPAEWLALWDAQIT